VLWSVAMQFVSAMTLQGDHVNWVRYVFVMDSC